jgi:hypothetical protein
MRRPGFFVYGAPCCAGSRRFAPNLMLLERHGDRCKMHGLTLLIGSAEGPRAAKSRCEVEAALIGDVSSWRESTI